MDFVEEVLRFLTARMQIEAEWAVQEQTSFTWWPHRLAQRVWVAPPREFQGVELSALDCLACDGTADGGCPCGGR
jgi:hypothetical protein